MEKGLVSLQEEMEYTTKSIEEDLDPILQLEKEVNEQIAAQEKRELLRVLDKTAVYLPKKEEKVKPPEREPIKTFEDVT